MFANKWYQSSPLAPQQQEKIWDLQHPQGYNDPETITSPNYQKPCEVDKTTKIPNRELRGKILKVVGIILAIAAGCGLLYWIYAAFWLHV